MTTKNIESSLTLTESQKKFLKQRGLYSAFKRAKQIKRAKRTEIRQNDRKQVILLERKSFKTATGIKRKTIIRDFFSLRILGTSKKSINTTIKNLNTKEKKVYKFGDKTFKSNFYIKRLSENRRLPLNNVVLLEKSRYIRNRTGQIYLNITFYKGNVGKTSEAGSNTPTDLSNSSNRESAFNEAFRGCLSQIDFSYDNYQVNWINYAYFIPKRKIQPVFQEKELEVAI